MNFWSFFWLRYPASIYILVHQEVGTIYTHHQKTLIVDADAGGNRRKIVAFVGGLDLCDGRYDTPQHPLFRTLQTDHKGDYHNPTFTVCLLAFLNIFNVTLVSNT